MNCRVCGSETNRLFEAKVLDKYEVTYFECPSCEFVQTEDPYWLDEAYSSAFTFTDTGVLSRTLVLGKSAATLLFLCFNRKRRFVDYAGGYGTLTRYMRDVGFDYYSTDPYAENLLARGFDAPVGRYEAATAFECFEHFVHPAAELKKILAFSQSIFFTTQPCPKPTPAVADWWYYSPHHGQHIAFYRPKTLRWLGQQHELRYYNFLNYHLFTPKRIGVVGFIFSVAGGRLGLVNLVRLFMKSRTVTDQNNLKEKQPTLQNET